jgi:hypothetical protein
MCLFLNIFESMSLTGWVIGWQAGEKEGRYEKIGSMGGRQAFGRRVGIQEGRRVWGHAGKEVAWYMYAGWQERW